MAEKRVDVLFFLKDKFSVPLKKIKSGLKSVNKFLGEAAKKAALASTALGGVFTATGIKTAADFELQMAKVAGKIGIDLVNGTAEAKKQFDDLSDAAKNIGATTEFTSVEAAQALEILGAAGLSTKDSISALGSVIDLATGQNLSLDEASSALVSTTNNLGLSFKNSSSTADLLAKTASSGNTTVTELGDAFQKTGSKAREAGLSNERLAAVFALLANNGLKGAEAGTQLRVVLRDITNENSTFQKALKANGLEVNSLDDLLRLLGDDFGKSSLATRTAALAMNSYGATVAKALSINVDNLDNLTEKVTKNKDAAALAAKTIRETLIKQIDILGSSFDALQQNIFTPLLPEFTTKVKELSQAFTDFAGNEPEIKKISDTLKKLFNDGVDSFKRFAKNFTFNDIVNKLTEFANSSKEKIKTLSETFIDFGVLVRGVGSTFSGTFKVIETAVAGFGAVATKSIQGFIGLITILPGLSEKTRRKYQIAFDAMGATSEALVTKVFDNSVDIGKSLGIIDDGLENTKNKFDEAGNSAEQALKKISDQSKVFSIELPENIRKLQDDVIALTEKYEGLANSGAATSEEIRAAQSAMIAKQNELSTAVKIYNNDVRDAAKANEEATKTTDKNTSSVNDQAKSYLDINRILDRYGIKLKQASKSLSTKELIADLDAAKFAFEKGQISADDYKKVLIKVGLSGDSVARSVARSRAEVAGFSKDFDKSVGGTVAGSEALGKAFKKLGITSQESLVKKNKEAKEAFDKIKQAQREGIVSTQDLEKAYSAYKKTVTALNVGIKKSFDELGIVMQSTLIDKMEKAKIAFDNIKASQNSGKSTIEDLRRAYQSYADTVIATGDKIKISQLVQQGLASGLKREFIEAALNAKGLADAIGGVKTELSGLQDFLNDGRDKKKFVDPRRTERQLKQLSSLESQANKAQFGNEALIQRLLDQVDKLDLVQGKRTDELRQKLQDALAKIQERDSQRQQRQNDKLDKIADKLDRAATNFSSSNNGVGGQAQINITLDGRTIAKELVRLQDLRG